MKNSSLFFPLLFAGAVFCVFLPHLLGGYTCAAITMEGVSQWHPFWTFAKRQVSAGCFPLWTPHSLGGWNLVAFSHSAVFYPLAAAFYIFPYARAFTFTVLLHLLITYFLMYRFLRGCKIESFPASLGSALWATSGLLLAYADFLPLLWTITWTPLFFDSAKRWVERGCAVDWFLFVAAASLQFLGGNVEGFAYEVTALGMLLVLFRQPEKLFLYRALSLLPALCIVALLTGVSLLPAIELLPRSVRSLGLSYSYFSERSFSLKYWASFFLPVNLLGNTVEGEKILVPSYLGLMTLIFFIYAISYGGEKFKSISRKLGVVVILFYLSAARDLPVVGALIYHIPVFNKMREPAYGLFVPQFFLAAIAAFGLNGFLSPIEQRFEELGKKQRCLLGILFSGSAVLAVIRVFVSYPWLEEEQYFLAAAAFFTTLLIVFSRSLGTKKALFFKAALALFFLSDNFAAAFTYFPRHKADFLAVDEDYRNFFSGMPPYERHIITDEYGARTPSLPPNAGMLINSQTLEGWEGIPDLRIIKFLSLLDERVVDFEDEKLDKIRHHFIFRDGKFLEPSNLPYLDLAGVRFIVSRGMPLKFASPVSLVDMREGFQITSWRAPVFSKERMNNFLYKIVEIKAPVAFSVRIHVYEGDSLNFRLCEEKTSEGIFDITVFADGVGRSVFSVFTDDISSCPAQLTQIALDEWKGKSVDLKFEFKVTGNGSAQKIYLLEPEIVNERKKFQRRFHGSVDIYENLSAFPRAFLRHTFVSLSDMEESFKWLREHGDSMAVTAPIENKQIAFWANVPAPLAPSSESVSIVDYKPDVVTISAEAKAPAFLILTDLYYPGWRAWVDGKEEKISPAYLAFRAVPISSTGEKQVVFKYEPISFRTGLWTVIASLLGLVFVSAYFNLRKVNAGSR